MILVTGAGAKQDAARAMRKVQNRSTRALRRSKSRHRPSSLPSGGYQPENVGYPCADLCTTCGYFLGLEGEDREAPKPECPACGDRAWVSLEVEPVASSVREMEAAERNRAPIWVRAAVVGAVLVVIGAVAGGLYLAGMETIALYAASSALVFVPAAYFGFSRPAATLLLRGRQRLPDRWHVPLPLPDESQKPTRTFEGVRVEPGDGLRRAPISGRECVAFQICVLFDTAGDARPPEWALEEQRASPIVVEGSGREETLRIEPGELYLETPVEFVHATGEEVLEVEEGREPIGAGVEEGEVERFLRKRGLFIDQGDFHFYEAILEPGDEIDVADYDGEMYIVEHSDRPDAAEVESLPETLGR